jgi:hypothetical protein
MEYLLLPCILSPGFPKGPLNSMPLELEGRKIDAGVGVHTIQVSGDIEQLGTKNCDGGVRIGKRGCDLGFVCRVDVDGRGRGPPGGRILLLFLLLLAGNPCLPGVLRLRAL